MPTRLESSAPHIHPALTWAEDLNDWGDQPDAIAGRSRSSGRLLWKSEGGAVEAGLWICTPGSWRLSIAKEEVCHFVSGRAHYRSDKREEIAVGSGTVAHFHPGWTGTCEVAETMRVIYMAAPYDGPADLGAAVMRDPGEIGDLVDWGPVPSMIEGQSRTSGKLLYRRPDRGAESGIWVCTPGLWECHVNAGDELCHFLSGRCTYKHESGEVIEILPDTAAFFPNGWLGTCRVHETVRKVYMIR
jgi:uncharacterized cupin superfamily protein